MNQAPITPEQKLEILKRDKFTCCYCRRSTPEVFLCIDNITTHYPDTHPLDSDGNLECCCAECHNKRHENYINPAARDFLQERREQFDQYLEWKSSNQDFRIDQEVTVIQYINGKLYPDFELSRQNIFEVKKALARYPLTDVLDVTDRAYLNTIRIGRDQKITRKSYEAFIENIPKYLYFLTCAPTEQAIRMLTGKTASPYKFGETCRKECFSTLSELAAKLRNIGKTDEEIISIINTEIAPTLDYAESWPKMRSYISSVRRKYLDR